jgi:hypothetical protein
MADNLRHTTQILCVVFQFWEVEIGSSDCPTFSSESFFLANKLYLHKASRSIWQTAFIVKAIPVTGREGP